MSLFRSISVSGLLGPTPGQEGADPRKINYLSERQDLEYDSDFDDEQLAGSETSEETPHGAAGDVCPTCGDRYGDDALFCRICGRKRVVGPLTPEFVLAWQAERDASSRAAAEVERLVNSFCSRTSLTKVAPTQKELDTLWSTLNDLASGLSDMGKAGMCDALVCALSEQLSGELHGHEWKPPLRTLCVLEFFYCKRGLERKIAEAVIDEASEFLKILSTEVMPCKEQALKVMQLSQLAEVLDIKEEIKIGSDGGMFVRKASDDDKVTPDDDQETNAGSCSLLSASDSQDEQFVTSWPSSLPVLNNPASAATESDDFLVLSSPRPAIHTVPGSFPGSFPSCPPSKPNPQPLFARPNPQASAEATGYVSGNKLCDLVNGPVAARINSRFSPCTAAPSKTLGEVRISACKAAPPVGDRGEADPVGDLGEMRIKSIVSLDSPATEMRTSSTRDVPESTSSNVPPSTAERPKAEVDLDVYTKTADGPTVAMPPSFVVEWPATEELDTKIQDSTVMLDTKLLAESIDALFHDFKSPSHYSTQQLGPPVRRTAPDPHSITRPLASSVRVTASEKQNPQRKTDSMGNRRYSANSIPWGIEDTLPTPADPFSMLAEGALTSLKASI